MKKILSIVISLTAINVAFCYNYIFYNETNDGTSPGGTIEVVLETVGGPDSPYRALVRPGEYHQFSTGGYCFSKTSVKGISDAIKGLNVEYAHRGLWGEIGFADCRSNSFRIKHEGYVVMPAGFPEKVRGGWLAFKWR